MKGNRSSQINETAQPLGRMDIQSREASTWLNANEAADHLRLSIADLVNLVKEHHVTVYRTLSSDPLFKRQELDAVMVPIPADEAGAFVTQSLQTQETLSHMTTSTSSKGRPEDFMPLKDAANALGTISYKTLLAMANRGVIPAKDIDASGRRRRWMVSLSAVKAALSSQAERETAMRRAPPQRIDLSRFARTGARHV